MKKGKQIIIPIKDVLSLYNNGLKDKYEPELTKELDNIGSRAFSHDDIHKITLWKVARFPHIDNDLLKKLNALANINDLNNLKERQQTRDVLEKLLKCSGVRLPMASTYLRFRNPNVFQIIDRHVWHQIMDKEYQELNSVKERVKIYFRYLNALKRRCKKDGVDFLEADRVYYWKDKKEGHKIGKSYQNQ